MSQKAPDEEVCQSLLDFVTEGTYPASENVISSGFPSSALSKELDLLSKAREQVEAEISSLSRENDFDADGWISQAKQLHVDIERSRVTAREIVAQHENTKPLQLKVEDAGAKVGLIETEIAFNQAVTDTLEEVQRLCQQLDGGRTALENGQIMAAIDTWESAEKVIKRDSLFTNTNVMSILSENAAGLRREIEESIRQRWSEQFTVNKQQAKLAIQNNRGALDDTITALGRLDMLLPIVDKFQRELILAIVDPILLPHLDGQSRGVRVGEFGVEVDSNASVVSVSEVLDRVTSVLSYLQQCLPTAILEPFSDFFIPTLSSKIISSWLSSAIPTDLGGLTEFEKTLDDVLKFTQTIESLGLHGKEELVSWVNQAPRLWLTRRRVDSLDQVRRVLAVSQGTTKQVDRVEKEKVSHEDEALLENATNDDWDAGWDEDKEEEAAGTAAPAQDEEEDVSAWGLDEDTNDTTETKPTSTNAEDDDAEDAWGWGDEDEDQQDVHSQTHAPITSKTVNGNGEAHGASQREVTLREQYTITDIPDSVLGIIQQQITDFDAISQPAYSNSRVTSSGAGLLALPTLILAMFKATASSFYTLKLNSGQMYLYNDSLYLADQIRTIVEEKQLSRLTSDIDALEKFGKFSYSKEMQTQRTIVTDLLDGAQGFSQCSEQPFLGECENAISATVDRIRYVYKEWQSILSHSALLQSIGSLVSTVINKIIIDIEDLGDISEPQSQRLVSFCTDVSKLEDLFTPEPTPGVESVPMTAVYVRSWLKFQYLVNILESSLADIRFLWQDGELRLEFSPDEVVDLIKALFAESDYRRKAIAEIRRTSRG